MCVSLFCIVCYVNELLTSLIHAASYDGSVMGLVVCARASLACAPMSFFFFGGAQSSDAVSAVRSDAVLRVDLAGYDPYIEVVSGALVAVRTLTQRAGVNHLLLDWVVGVLPHAE